MKRGRIGKPQAATPQAGCDGSTSHRQGAARVMLITGTLEVGGTEQQLVGLAAHLDRGRFDPRICCLDRPGPLASRLARAGVPVDAVRFRGLSPVRDPVHTGRCFLQLVALLRRQRPAIVQTFLRHANALGALAARLACVPAVVVSIRSLDPEVPVWGRIGMRLADLVLANAEAVRQHAVAAYRLPAGKVRVIRNGVDADAIRRAAVGPPRDLPQGRLVVTVANPSRFKVDGLLVLAQAAGRVLARVPEARFLLVGGGTELGRVEAAVQHLGDRFQCLGPRSDVPAILAAAELSVLPSLREGLPNAVMEAMAAGKPVVASRVGGVPELVVDGETGFLVPPRDPEALAGAVLALLGDSARAEGMGEAGRERVIRCFSLDRMVRETQQLYEELLATKGDLGR